MSQRINHQIPQQLGTPAIHDACAELDALPEADEYIIDVSQIQHFEPIAMLLLGAAIRRLQRRRDGAVRVHLVGRDDGKIQGHSYASRMGFWWSVGEETIEPRPSSNPAGATIPITRLDIATLYRQSAGADPVRSGTVSRAAAQAATLLCGDDKQTPLWDALEYAFREMFRNTVEHSRAESIWYTASTRPQRDDVQLAILDEGCGIRESLEGSGLYKFSSDAEAIQCALRPGVSRNLGKQRTPEQERRLREDHPDQDPAEWDNSGYGLTLATDLCRHAGQFSIVTGTASVSFNRADITSTASHQGTAMRFVIQPSRVSDALAKVGLAGESPRGGRASQSLLSASQRRRRSVEP